MIINRRGFSLLEVIITSALLAIIVGAFGQVIYVTYKVWNQGYVRLLMQQETSQALGLISKQFRHVYDIDSVADSSLEYTMTDVNLGNVSYRLYLHHEDDAEPNPPYSESVYDLRLTDSLNYGEGIVLIRNVSQPTSPVFSRTGDTVTIDFTTASSGQQMNFRTNLTPRNPL